MTRFSVSARDRRTILIGAAVLAPFLLYLYGVRPYVTALSDTRAQVELEQDLLVRERSLLADQARFPALHRRADSVSRELEPRLFTHPDAGLATAQLATYLDQQAHTARVQLVQTETQPAATNSDGVRTLRVEIRGESDLEGMLTFLRRLEDGSKLIRVERLTLDRQMSRTVEGRPGVELMTIAAVIQGFGLTDSIPSPPKKGTTARRPT